jgi:hypothetical protein
MESLIPGKCILAYSLALLLPLLVIGAVAWQPWVPAAALLRDPLAVANTSATCCSPYFGAVSHLGVLLWTGTAAVCLVAGASFLAAGRAAAAWLPLAAGLLTAVLAVDDLFMVHERVLPFFGMPERLTLLLYVVAAAAYLVAFHRQIFAARFVVMAIALAAFGVSFVGDLLLALPEAAEEVIEDGAKFIGICAWSAFHLEVVVDRTVAFCGVAATRSRRHGRAVSPGEVGAAE